MANTLTIMGWEGPRLQKSNCCKTLSQEKG
jgi:hypothetical protein